MVIAMPSDGGSTASYDGSWNENYYPSNGYYYSGAAYRAAARNRVSDRMQNWRPRATPHSKIGCESERYTRRSKPKSCFAILRLYGPTEAAIDKSWKPGDIKKVK